MTRQFTAGAEKMPNSPSIGHAQLFVVMAVAQDLSQVFGQHAPLKAKMV